MAAILPIVEVQSSTYYAWRKRQASNEQSPSTGKAGKPRPGYSVTNTGQKVSDEQIKEWLMELVSGEEGIYGYKKLTYCLKNEHDLVIGKNKVYWMCDELDILQPQRQVKVKYPRRLSNNLVITAPNQLWQMDIKYGYVAKADRFFYLLGIIDVFDRTLVGYHLGRSCKAEDACRVVQESLLARSCGKVGISTITPIIRTDNGPQFVSYRFEEYCEREKLVHERIPPKTPNKNAFIESFHSVLERELLQGVEFQTFEEAFYVVKQYIDFYNQRRIHGSLKYLSPAKFNQAWQDNKYPDMKVSV